MCERAAVRGSRSAGRSPSQGVVQQCDRRVPDGDRAGPAADAQGRLADRHATARGPRATEIAAIKVVAPRVALRRASTARSRCTAAPGVSDDVPLARDVGRRAHAAHRRRPGRGAPPLRGPRGTASLPDSRCWLTHKWILCGFGGQDDQISTRSQCVLPVRTRRAAGSCPAGGWSGTGTAPASPGAGRDRGRRPGRPARHAGPAPGPGRRDR